MKKLIEQLETYRLERRISQEGLAAKLGVVFSAANRRLNGKSTSNEIQSCHIQKLLILKGKSKNVRKKHDKKITA